MFRNSENVIVLDDKSFNYSAGKATLKAKGFDGILLAYAEWCPHCQSKEDISEEMGSIFNDKSNADRMYVINADENREFSQAAGLTHFPMFFRINKKGEISKLESNFNLAEKLEKLKEMTN